MATPRPKADWEAIERDYRTGKWSDPELARKHGNVVTRQAIAKRAKQNGWTKDLTAAVRQATAAKLVEADAAKQAKLQVADQVAAQVAPTVAAVQAVAALNAAVIQRHRDDALRGRELAVALLDELLLHTHRPDVLEALAKAALGDEQGEVAKQARARMFEKVNDALSVHNRVASVNRIADTLKKLQEMERKAHNLDDDGGGKPPVDPAKFEGDPHACYMEMIRG